MKRLLDAPLQISRDEEPREAPRSFWDGDAHQKCTTEQTRLRLKGIPVVVDQRPEREHWYLGREQRGNCVFAALLRWSGDRYTQRHVRHRYYSI